MKNLRIVAVRLLRIGRVKITIPCGAHVDIRTPPREKAHQDTSMRLNLLFVEQCSQTAFHDKFSLKESSKRAQIMLMVLLNSDVFSREIPALEAVSRSWKETYALVTLKHRFATFFLLFPQMQRTNCMLEATDNLTVARTGTEWKSLRYEMAFASTTK